MKSLRLSVFLALAVSVSSLSVNNRLATPHAFPRAKDEGIQFYRPYKLLLELRKKDTFIRHCGGAQLNEQWYLTAAECVDRSKYDSMRMLRFDKYHNVTGAEMIWLDLKVHPEYNKNTKENNIALLKGYSHGTPYNIPRLPPTSDTSKTVLKGPAVVLVWTNWPKTESLTMANLDTTVINALWCKLAYHSKFRSAEHICASGVQNNGLSQDDVGAPLIITYSDKIKELIGVATDIWPFTNILPMPMVFTRIAPYVDWIRKETNITIPK